MKTATARKSFTHSPTGRRLRTGDHVPPTDPHMMGELKANGLVENVKDASKAETDLAGDDLAIASMTHAVLEPGDSPRVSIQFRDKREAGFFRETFAQMRASIEDLAKERPEPRRTAAPAPRTTKPDRTPRKTAVEPEPGQSGGPGAGGGSGAGAGDGSQSDGDAEEITIGEGRVLTRGALIFSAIRQRNENLADGETERDRAEFDALDDETRDSIVRDEVERLAGLDDEAFAAETMPDGDDGVVEEIEEVEKLAPAGGRKPRGNRSAA